ncbi:uracil-DNA glycosylase family protein [Pseudorhodobacter sp.]|uniref:uracil-DNA glycosylase n=1 Tax=Pseudorhodobacter sp. TaxID=1934400 RepID=UPI00264A0F4E|nr:uracil-DNA glycosylase [Pseudorhodobacter sp.]MDN5785967.1 uracil-DNA glycosylase [Pseudorhodobacter sp.]
MGIDLHLTENDWHATLAALCWQVDLGVTEVMAEAPIDRYSLPDKLEAPKTKPVAEVKSAAPPGIDAVQIARDCAAACGDLSGLRDALAAFELCELKKGARQLVFSDGNPAARLMVVGEAPGRDEDRAGKPFIGQAGQLLDRMLAAIGISRTEKDSAKAAYITNVIPWRPPANRDPTPEEIAMMQPFLSRHIALAKPHVIIAMGNTSCAALLGTRGIMRLRGNWAETQGIPVMPMAHPAYLLRNAAAKRDAWADLLMVQARLRSP